jgi:hypothetical protein
VPIGVRGFGYDNAGAPLETPTWCELATRQEVSEAQVAREIFERFYSGDSLAGIASWLNERGVPTRYGAPWRANSVRQILVNPRYCGRVVYKHRTADPGEAVQAAFGVLVDEAVFDAVNERLADPRRKTAFGTDRKHLGSSVYQCCICAKLVRSTGAQDRTAYKCPDRHVTRRARQIDDYVTRLIRERLGRRDLAALLAAPAGREAAEAAEAVKVLRGRLQRTRLDYDEDLIDALTLKRKTAKIQAELDQAEARRARLLAGSEIAGVVGAEDPVAAFNAAPLGVKQSVIRFFCTEELLPVPRGRRGFDPESVRVTPRQT